MQAAAYVPVAAALLFALALRVVAACARRTLPRADRSAAPV
ncbi:MAG: hypothetical protein ACJ741_15955 [Pyrinomonadaceae bacterium]